MTWEPDTVIYHDHCMDGFTAAWACAKRWPNATFIATNYGRTGDVEWPTLEEKNILIVDFSYPAATLMEMVTVWKANSVVILDHHMTAKSQLEAFQRYADKPERFTQATVEGMLGGLHRGGYPPICAMFDMKRSGAGLAWDFAFSPDSRPHLVDLVEDRDLWRFAFGDKAKHLHLALNAGPITFDRWDQISENVAIHVQTGAAIASYRDGIVLEIVKRSWLGKIDGKTAAIVDCPYALASDVGHALLDHYYSADLAAIRVADQDNISWSLRSNDQRADVSAIAEKFGGGGHRNAAGFRVPK